MPIFTSRFALALFALALAVTLLIIGMWQRPTEKSQHTNADGGQGPPTTMPTSALTPYIPFIMIIAPLAATVTGVYLASRVAESQRRKDEDRRRRALATRRCRYGFVPLSIGTWLPAAGTPAVTHRTHRRTYAPSREYGQWRPQPNGARTAHLGRRGLVLQPVGAQLQLCL
jgi:hypothetical protein